MDIGPDPVSVIQKKDSGVPVTVVANPMKPTGAETEPIPLNMKVGGNSISVAHEKLAQGVPVTVDPVVMKNEMADTKLGLKMRIGPDEVSVAKKKASGVPVLVDPVIAKPTGAESEKLGIKGRIGPDEVSVEKKPVTQTLLQAANPVVNPPFNNWSVNQPSVPHAHGLSGNADLGQNLIVDGHAVHV